MDKDVRSGPLLPKEGEDITASLRTINSSYRVDAMPQRYG